jgi:hypothetical protein
VSPHAPMAADREIVSTRLLTVPPAKAFAVFADPSSEENFDRLEAELAQPQ